MLMLERLEMTSYEIAELTGKRHNNVIRDIRKMYMESDTWKCARLNISISH